MSKIQLKNGLQRGMALIIALLLLLVLTLLGVASMSGTLMQERMAGNVNLQTLAFEAASAGVSEAPMFLDPTNLPASCIRGDGWQPTDWTAMRYLDVPNLPQGTQVGYQMKVGCFEPDEPPEYWDEYNQVPLQLLVLSQGQVSRGDDILSQREVEVRIENRGDSPDCLITVGPVDTIVMGSSAQHEVHGGDGGCPIRTVDPDDAAEMNNQLSVAQLQNYQPDPPGIHAGPLRDMWGSPLDVGRAVNAIKIGIRAHDSWNVPGEPNPFASCAGTLHPGDSNSAPTGGITYVAGNLTVGGSSVTRGTVFVEGEMRFNGSATYQADLVLLGGHLLVNGFGNTGNKGSLNLHHLQERNPSNSFQPAYNTDESSPPVVDYVPSTLFNVNGMGKASITEDDCVDLQGRWDGINQCLDHLESYVRTDSPDGIEESLYHYYHSLMASNSPPPSPSLAIPDFGDEDHEGLVRFPVPRCGGFGGATRQVIASWREYIDRQRWDL